MRFVSSCYTKLHSYAREPRRRSYNCIIQQRSINLKVFSQCRALLSGATKYERTFEPPGSSYSDCHNAGGTCIKSKHLYLESTSPAVDLVRKQSTTAWSKRAGSWSAHRNGIASASICDSNTKSLPAEPFLRGFQRILQIIYTAMYIVVFLSDASVICLFRSIK